MMAPAMRNAWLLAACAAAYPPRWHKLGVPPKPLSRTVRYASAEPRDAAADPQQTSRLAAALKPARGPLDKEIAAVALPAMLSLAVFPVVGMVDTFFVGRMGSALSLAGQGAANAAFNFCFFVLAVVPTLTAPRVARASARGDDEAVRTTARESLWIAGAVGLCGTVALVGWPRYFLKRVLPANAPALAPAARYLRYRALGYLPALLSSTCFAAFRGLLDTATPLRISLFYNALNAVLDPILIFGCGLGVAGAALATALAESVGCLMYLSQLSKRIGGRKLLPTFWRRPPARATVAPVWKSTIELGSFFQCRVDGVGRLQFDFHTGQGARRWRRSDASTTNSAERRVRRGDAIGAGHGCDGRQGRRLLDLATALVAGRGRPLRLAIVGGRPRAGGARERGQKRRRRCRRDARGAARR